MNLTTLALPFNQATIVVVTCHYKNIKPTHYLFFLQLS